MAKTTLPAKVEEYTALQAQSTFTKAEEKAFKELNEYITKRAKDDIWWYWELGQKVKKIYEDAKDREDIYGKRVLLRMAKALGYKTDQQLRNTMTVVETFKTKKEFNKLVRLKGEAQNTLNWSHLVYLAQIGDDKLRNQLAASTLEQSWNAKDLWDRVKELANRKKRGSGAKVKTKIPASPVGMFSHVRSQANKFVQNFEEAWTGDVYDICGEVASIPADKLNDKLVQAVADTRAKLVSMQECAASLEEQLMQVEEDIEARRKAQAEAEEEAAAAEAAEEDYEDDIDEGEDDDDDFDPNDDVYAEDEAEDAEEEEDDEVEEDSAQDEEDWEEEETVNLGKQRNAQRRAKSAAEREKKKKREARAAARRKGRVGVSK